MKKLIASIAVATTLYLSSTIADDKGVEIEGFQQKESKLAGERIELYDLIDGSRIDVFRVEYIEDGNSSESLKRAGLQIPLQTPAFQGYVRVFGENNNLSKTGAGINLDGCFKQIIFGGALEKLDDSGATSQLNNVYSGIKLGSNAMKLGYSKLDSEHFLNGVNYETFNGGIFGFGGKTGSSHEVNLTVGKNGMFNFLGARHNRENYWSQLIVGNQFTELDHIGFIDNIDFGVNDIGIVDSIIDYQKPFPPALIHLWTNTLGARVFYEHTDDDRFAQVEGVAYFRTLGKRLLKRETSFDDLFVARLNEYDRINGVSADLRHGWRIGVHKQNIDFFIEKLQKEKLTAFVGFRETW